MSIRPLHFFKGSLTQYGVEETRVNYGMSSYWSDDRYWTFDKAGYKWWVQSFAIKSANPYYAACAEAGIFDTGFPRLTDAIEAVETVMATMEQ